MLFNNTVFTASVLWIVAVNCASLIYDRDHRQSFTASSNGRPNTLAYVSEEGIASSRTESSSKATPPEGNTEDELQRILETEHSLVECTSTFRALISMRNHDTISGQLKPRDEIDEYADLEKGDPDIFPPPTVKGVLDYIDQLQEGIEDSFGAQHDKGHHNVVRRRMVVKKVLP